MSTVLASQLLRAGLLDGVGALVVVPAQAAARERSPAAQVCGALSELGASVCECEAPSAADGGLTQELAEQALERTRSAGAALQLLVLDAAGLFAAGPDPGQGGPQAGADPGQGGPQAGAQAAGAQARAALAACLQSTWTATRAVAQGALLPGGRGGRVLYVMPPAPGGELAGAARAGLENLARTLSIEWARHAITVVAIAPGATTEAGEVAALVAYLASPAGAYFSGCLLDMCAGRPAQAPVPAA